MSDDHAPLNNPQPSASQPPAESGWERRVLEKLALDAVTEQRRRRRWGIFFKLLTAFYVGVLFWMLGDFGASDGLEGRHTALISVEGEIASGTEASADRLIGALQSAFEDKGTAGVVLRINSPGGSPVQAGMVNDEIHRLRKLHPELPVYAVVEDTCASGAYYIAVAADRIYVDKASMVGSIGVLMDGFGFTGLMGKLGVERRLLTAGENKGMLDSFSPQSPRQLEHVKEMLGQIHAQFIAVVRQGRGERLQEKEHPELFSGLIWTGERSLQLGLADDYGTVESVARDVIKEETLKDFTLKENLAERVAQRFGASMTESMGRGAARVLERVGLR